MEPRSEIAEFHMSDNGATDGLKQVIVIRHDLKMRQGKSVAQGSHASSMIFLTGMNEAKVARIKEWVEVNGMRKICCRVESEQELKDLFEKAQLAGLEAHMIVDSGHTEFHGQETATCIAIGPNKSAEVDLVTGHLPLL